MNDGEEVMTGDTFTIFGMKVRRRDAGIVLVVAAMVIFGFLMSMFIAGGCSS